MARPRTPVAKASVEARDKKDPGRFKNRVDPKDGGPLGEPPNWVKDSDENKARSAWLLFEREIPWLTESHRMLIGMASNIQGRLMAGQDVGVQAMNLLRQMLGQMGATPADSTKVTVNNDEEEDDDGLD